MTSTLVRTFHLLVVLFNPWNKLTIFVFVFVLVPAENEVSQKKGSKKQAGELLSSIALKNTRDATASFTAYQKQALKKMKSITDASDDVCASILSKNDFKLNDSIEHFYRGER